MQATFCIVYFVFFFLLLAFISGCQCSRSFLPECAIVTPLCLLHNSGNAKHIGVFWCFMHSAGTIITLDGTLKNTGTSPVCEYPQTKSGFQTSNSTTSKFFLSFFYFPLPFPPEEYLFRLFFFFCLSPNLLISLS